MVVSPEIRLCVAGLGDSCSGNTSLIHRLTRGTFTHDAFSPTIGTNIVCMTHLIKEQLVIFYLKDMATRPRFCSIWGKLLKDIDHFYLYFDLTNPDSLDHLYSWHEIALDANPRATGFLIGTKLDLVGSRELAGDVINAFARKMDMRVVLTSAKTGEGCDAVKRELLRFVPSRLLD